MMESGAHAVGCTVFPAGVGQTELQLQAIAELRPNAYIGTPSFLRILVEKAAGVGRGHRPACARRVLAARPSRPALRDWFAAARHRRATSAMPRPTSA